MNVGIILICLLFLALWWFDKTLDKRKLVLACSHENLEVRVLPKSLGGTLFLHCKCGYQAHLRELRHRAEYPYQSLMDKLSGGIANGRLQT